MTNVGRVALVAALTVGGCATTRTLEANALTSAQHQLNCEAASIAQRSKNTWEASGCGESVVIMCARDRCSNLNGVARQRFSREFSCRGAETAVVQIDHRVFRVEGCGQRAVYQCEMRDLVGQCAPEGSREDERTARAELATEHGRRALR